MTDRLRIGIQKKGRLSEGSFDLLKRCGLKIQRRGDELLCAVRNLPIDLLLLRDDDIPGLVADGTCDLGIVGQNVLYEEQLERDSSAKIDIVEALGFSRCSLQLAAPGGTMFTEAADLAGKRIATTYPRLVEAFFSDRDLSVETVVMKGGVEIAPSLGLVDGICDLVSSGATLAANGLVAFETILESEAVLIRHKGEFDAPKQDSFDRLLSRMRGVIASRDTKYIMLNASRADLPGISAVLPGADAPTIMNLATGQDQVAVHAVCRETVFWDTLEALKARGARDILVLPIEKMMG